MMSRENIGKRVGELRNERNLSQAEFGKMIGISGQSLGKIERGAATISVNLIDKICNVTGVSADYLLFGIIEPDHITEALYGLSKEQIQIVFEIIKKVAQFLNTDDGNETLIREIFARKSLIT